MRIPCLIGILALAAGCEVIVEPGTPDPPADFIDKDGDGYNDGIDDCDDGLATANPDGTEICNGVDDDCDGVVDNGATDGSAFYPDLDLDGYGDDAGSVVACEAPEDHVAQGGDCDDGLNTVNPAVDERCNDIDDNCDGAVDEGGGTTNWYADLDGDNYGDPTAISTACTIPADHVVDNTDCDDGVADINPNSDEYCNGIDNDCNGVADNDAVDQSIWYDDVDGDGYGDDITGFFACDGGSAIAAGGDCDDGDSLINPGATETCDSVDEDCDGIVDNGATPITWFRDLDDDGWGDELSADTSIACTQPDGYAAGGDCDDTLASVNPDESEVLCDGLDNNCDPTDLACDIWTHNGPGNGDDRALGVTLDNDGNLIVVGGLGQGTNSDLWVQRLDQNLNPLAATTVGGSQGSGDWCQGVAVDGNNDIFISGYWKDRDPTRLDYLVAKFRGSDLGLDWTRDVVAPSGEIGFASAIAVDPTTGEIQSAGYLGALANRIGQMDRHDATGNFVWGGAQVHDSTTGLFGMVMRDNGTALVAGYSSDSTGQEQTLLREIDASGNVAWTSTFDVASGGRDQALAVTWDDVGGEIYLTGWAEFGAGTGSRDIFVIKTDGSGNEIWTTTFDAFGSRDEPRAILLASDGRIHVAGFTKDPPSGLNEDFGMITLDSNGTVLSQWQEDPGGGFNDRWVGMTELPDGDLVLVGYGNAGTGRDAFVRRYTP